MNIRERELLIECCKELDAMKEGSDAEIEHGRAEDILCELLSGLGFHKAADSFNAANDRVGFWYA